MAIRHLTQCDAMGQRSYHGTFVHLHNNKIESMEIIRRKDENGDENRANIPENAEQLLRPFHGYAQNFWMKFYSDPTRMCP